MWLRRALSSSSFAFKSTSVTIYGQDYGRIYHSQSAQKQFCWLACSGVELSEQADELTSIIAEAVSTTFTATMIRSARWDE